MNIYGNYIEESYLEEGLFFKNKKQLIDKLAKFADEYEKDPNNTYKYDRFFKLYGKVKKLDLTPEENKQVEELVKRVMNAKDNVAKKYISTDIKNTYKYWTELDTRYTWEGKVLKTLYLLGISVENIAKHFSKHNKLQSLYDCLHAFNGEKDQSDVKLFPGMSLEDKCFEIYSNDDNIVVYDYTIKSYVDIQDKLYKVNNLYKDYLHFIEDYDEEDKKQYQNIAKELGLSFKI